MPSNLILALQSQTVEIPRNSKGLKHGVVLLAARPSAEEFGIRSQEFRLVVHLVFWLTYSVFSFWFGLVILTIPKSAVYHTTFNILDFLSSNHAAVDVTYTKN